MMLSVNTQKTRQIITYIVGLFLLLIAFLPPISYQNTPEIHTLLEFILIFFALMISCLSILRFSGRRNLLYLFIGLGFLIPPVLEGYSALITSSAYSFFFSNTTSSFWVWEEFLGRTCLALFLFASWATWHWREKYQFLKDISEKWFYIGTSLLVFSLIAILELVTLPETTKIVIGSLHIPLDIIPAGILLITTIGYWRKKAWQTNNFEYWLLFSLFTGFCSAIAFIMVTDEQFDLKFNIAHLLQLISYICILVGLIFNIFYLFRKLEREIIKRKQTEDALKQSEMAYRLLIENSVQGFSLTQDGQATIVNPAFANIVGYPIEELSKLDVLQFVQTVVYPDDREIVINSYEKALAGNLDDIEPFEARIVRKDGEIRWVKAFPTFFDFMGKLANQVVITDITEQKHTFDQLQMMSNLIQFADMGVLSVSVADKTVTSWNPSATRIFGYEPEEIIGQPLSLLLPPNKKEELIEVLQKILKEKAPSCTLETTRLTKTGKLIDVFLVISPMYNENGNIKSLSTFIRDISAEKQLESTYQALFDQSLQGIALFQDDQVKLVNPALAQITGYTQEEILTMPVVEINQRLIIPDEQEMSLQRYQSMHDGMITPYAYTTRMMKPDGTVSWLKVYPSNITYHGNPAIQMVVLDITDQKEAERLVQEKAARMQAILDATVDGIITIDEQGVIESVNPAMSHIFGYSKEGMLGQNVTMLMSASYHQKHVLYMENYIKEGIRQTIWTERELIALHKEGHTFPIELSINELFINNKRLFTGIIRDITERKKTEQVILESEARWRQLYQNLPLPTYIWQHTDDGLVLANFNKIASEITQGAIENLMGVSAYRLYANRPDIITDLHTCFENQTSFTREMTYNMQSLSAEQRHLIARYSFVPPDLVLVHTDDVTERKKMERNLRKSEATLNKAQELSHMGSWQWDLETDEVLWSDELFSIFGLDKTEVDLAKLYDEFFKHVHPDDKEVLIQNNKITVEKHIGHPVDFRIVRPDGTVRYVSSQAEMFSWEPTKDKIMVGTIQDITKRIEADRQLYYQASLLKNVSEAIISTSPNFMIESWNEFAEIMYGYTKQEAIGKYSIDLIPPTYVSHTGKEVAKELQKTGRWQGEAIQYHKDGHQIYVLSSVSMIRDDNQKVVGAIAINRDISDLKYKEKELREAKELAEQASLAKSEFLAHMSHEIRTPMNAVIGMTSLLLNTALAPQQRHFVENIRHSGDALLTILNDILDFSKIEANELKLEKQPFSIQFCIQSALDLVSTIALEKGLLLEIKLDENLPEVVYGDITRLRQVLVNLLSNAIKFTEKGNVTLEAQTIQAEKEDWWELLFAVHDTGVGIPLSQQDNLFQAFSQVNTSITRLYGGTGLGLAISRNLVEMMGGYLCVESEVGKGSSFYFTIQAQQTRESPPEEEKLYEQPTNLSPEVAKKHPLTILVAEDHRVNQQIITMYLRQLGYSADVAGNGLEVISALQRQPYDVILMDIQMPIMDGITATKTIRSEFPSSKQPYIIAITATATMAHRQKCLDAGVNNYISKPFRPQKLMAALSQSYHRIQDAPMLNTDEVQVINEEIAIFAPREIEQVETEPSAIIDYSALDNLKMGFGDEYFKVFPGLVEIFCEETEKLISRAEQAITQNDTTILYKAMHTLSSSAGSCGATKVSYTATQLEKTAYVGHMPQDVESLITKLKEEYLEAKQVLTKLATNSSPDTSD